MDEEAQDIWDREEIATRRIHMNKDKWDTFKASLGTPLPSWENVKDTLRKTDVLDRVSRLADWQDGGVTFGVETWRDSGNGGTDVSFLTLCHFDASFLRTLRQKQLTRPRKHKQKRIVATSETFPWWERWHSEQDKKEAKLKY
tara:strand:- start:271 stop:699 length:429 start_codon:yes stop_codon:yes gene_type:complete